MAVMVIISIGRFPLLYVPKTIIFYSEIIILGMLWVRTEASDN